ncbi:MAG TPA: hypothetical protein PLV42_05320 [bacterium]|nr:hypothetical protein [bacterium]
MSFWEGFKDPVYLIVNGRGLPVAGSGLTIEEAGPFMETLHSALESAETEYAVWNHGAQKYLGTGVGDCFLIVKCGPGAPLTRLIYSLGDIRARCARSL